MTIPCSAYCAPEKGLHAIVDALSRPASEWHDMIGHAGISDPGLFCTSDKGPYTFLAFEEAPESNYPTSEGFPYRALITVQLLSWEKEEDDDQD